MDLIADMLLAAGAIGAALYCYVLARRLSRFNDLEKGVGGAVAVLSAQVDDLNRTLVSAQKTAAASSSSLGAVTERAEKIARRLELHLASLHDLPDPSEPSAQAPSPTDAAFSGRANNTNADRNQNPASDLSAVKQPQSDRAKPQPKKAKPSVPKSDHANPIGTSGEAKPAETPAQESRRSKKEPIFPRHSEAEVK